MNNLSIDDILLINQIAKYNSFVKAGDSLGIPKSSVSRRVKFIEGYLGTKLFNRSGRKISTTRSADQILHHTHDIESQWTNIVNRLKSVTENGDGELKIRGLGRVNRMVSKTLLPKMIEMFPGLRIEMYSTTKEPEADRFDVDLMFNSKPISSPKFTNEAVAVSKQLFVASPLYLKHNPTPSNPRDLRNHRLIGSNFPGDPKDQWSWKEGTQVFFADIEPAMIVEEPESLLDLAVNGQGIAWLPEFLCSTKIREGKLVSLFDSSFSVEGYLWAIYPNSATESRTARKFIDLVKESRLFGEPFNGDADSLLREW